MDKHAKLSASGSERWILCPGSVAAEEGIPEKPNPYTEEGTLAHEVAATFLKDEIVINNITSEMLNNIINYSDYITAIEKDLKEYSLLIEQKVDFSHVVPDGFGTADCIIKSDDVLHVIDLKYGKGVPVYAENNTQLLLYAIGALNGFTNYMPSSIVMHIVQPRIGNYSKWEITKPEYELDYWIEFLRKKALAALQPDAKRIPHKDACRWCRAKPTCRAIYNFIDHTIAPLKEKKALTDNELKLILDNSKLITDFLSSVEELVYDKIASGESFKGYKLVNGRQVRKFKTDSLEELENSLGESIYKKVPITLAEAEKIFSKEVINEITYKQQSKPILVPDSDKRAAITTLQFDNENKTDDMKVYQKNYRTKQKQIKAVKGKPEILTENSFKY